MYFVYSDEAGISQPEPVSVVVGVILHADIHWASASAELAAAIDRHVPQALRDGFFFHAKDVWSGYRDYDLEWSRAERAQFIGDVAAIPRKIEAALAVGKVRRDSGVPDVYSHMAPHDFHHCLAFSSCIGRSNKYVRDWGEPNEVATVVAENVDKNRSFLKEFFKIQPEFDLNWNNILPTFEEIFSGKILQTQNGPIDKIIDTIHFVGKREAPLLQLADACAFIFRRYFSEQEYGEEMLSNMLGQKLIWSEWQGPVSQFVFSFNPNRIYGT